MKQLVLALAGLLGLVTLGPAASTLSLTAIGTLKTGNSSRMRIRAMRKSTPTIQTASVCT